MNETKMDKEERLIRAAMKLFVEYGFEKSSTAQISKEAKVATGTLYNYFESKEELISKTYLYVKQRMIKASLEQLDPKADIRDKFKQVWFSLIQWGFENRYESKFLERFYGSTYIDKEAVEEAKINNKEGMFLMARKEKLLKDISQKTMEKLTMSIFNCYLDEFLEIKRIDEKLLMISWETYWDAITK